VIRTAHRRKGPSALGARHPGERGPYGIRPGEDDHDGHGQDEQLDDDTTERTTK
jgi:hypothetical protein